MEKQKGTRFGEDRTTYREANRYKTKGKTVPVLNFRFVGSTIEVVLADY